MTTPVTLHPPGPALTLNMAAAKLRPVAEAAVESLANDGCAPADWYATVDNYLGGPIGDLCGLLTPELALDLCDFLDEIATEAVRRARMGGTEEAVTDGYPIRMAQRVLGGEAL